jgi:predicted secreted protein
VTPLVTSVPGENAFNPASPVTTTPAGNGKKMVTFTEADNGKTSDIAQGTRFAVELSVQNTEFMWNATVSDGLVIEPSKDIFHDPSARGVNAPNATRVWVIVAKDAGPHAFSATYERFSEPVTGRETAYSVNVQVIKA